MGSLPLTVLVCEGAVSDALSPSAWLSLCLLRGQPTCLGSLSPPGEFDTAQVGELPSCHILLPFFSCRSRSCLEMIISSVFWPFPPFVRKALCFPHRLPHFCCFGYEYPPMTGLFGGAKDTLAMLLSEKPSRFLISRGPDCVIYLPPGQKLVCRLVSSRSRGQTDSGSALQPS